MIDECGTFLRGARTFAVQLCRDNPATENTGERANRNAELNIIPQFLEPDVAEATGA
jgi:hypothetical protein